MMDATAVIGALRETVPEAVLTPLDSVDMPTIGVDRDHLVDVCQALRTHPALQYGPAPPVVRRTSPAPYRLPLRKWPPPLRRVSGDAHPHL